MGENRRLDRWVGQAELEFNHEEINRQTVKVERELRKENDLGGFLYNNEDLGMNDKEIQQHEEFTKLKTINYI